MPALDNVGAFVVAYLERRLMHEGHNKGAANGAFHIIVAPMQDTSIMGWREQKKYHEIDNGIFFTFGPQNLPC